MTHDQMLQEAGEAFERARLHLATPAEAMADALHVLARMRRTGLPVSVPLSEGVTAVIEAVLSFHGAKLKDVTRTSGTGRSVSWRMAMVRDEAVFAARAVDPTVSYPTLGKLFRRHHASLIDGQRKFAARMQSDELLATRMRRVVEVAARRAAVTDVQATGGAA